MDDMKRKLIAVALVLIGLTVVCPWTRYGVNARKTGYVYQGGTPVVKYDYVTRPHPFFLQPPEKRISWAHTGIQAAGIACGAVALLVAPSSTLKALAGLFSDDKDKNPPA